MSSGKEMESNSYLSQREPKDWEEFLVAYRSFSSMFLHEYNWEPETMKGGDEEANPYALERAETRIMASVFAGKRDEEFAGKHDKWIQFVIDRDEEEGRRICGLKPDKFTFVFLLNNTKDNIKMNKPRGEKPTNRGQSHVST